MAKVIVTLTDTGHRTVGFQADFDPPVEATEMSDLTSAQVAGGFVLDLLNGLMKGMRIEEIGQVWADGRVVAAGDVN